MTDVKLEGRREGFSLVEVMVATMILTVGLLAMAASTGYVWKELRSSIYDTQRTHAKMQVIEQLRAMPYANVQTNSTGWTAGATGSTSGGTTTGSQNRFTMTWTVQTMSTFKRVTLTTSGPGYTGGRAPRTTVVDVMTFDIMSPT